MGRRRAKQGAAKGAAGRGSRWRPAVLRRQPAKADSDAALRRRVKRIRRALYDLYGDLEYFKSGPAEHREALRRGLDWPDVGHITSLARSLAEERRFADWLRFNRCLNAPVFVRKLAREKSA